MFLPIAQVPKDLTVNNSHIERFLKSTLCAKHPYDCQAKLKFEKFKWEIHYIIQIFHATYRKFLVAKIPTASHLGPASTVFASVPTKTNIITNQHCQHLTPLLVPPNTPNHSSSPAVHLGRGDITIFLNFIHIGKYMRTPPYTPLSLSTCRPTAAPSWYIPL